MGPLISQILMFCFSTTSFFLRVSLQVPFVLLLLSSFPSAPLPLSFPLSPPLFSSSFIYLLSLGYLTSMGVPDQHFTHIFVDEAGEALEPETLIPLFLANAKTSIVLAGDHLQLGPIVRYSKQKKETRRNRERERERRTKTDGIVGLPRHWSGSTTDR